MFMKSLGISIFAALACLIPAHADFGPRSVALEAQKAVQAMGDEMRAGNYEVSIANMYPRWKKRLAARKGGMQRLDQQLTKAINDIKTSGIIIQSYIAHEPSVVYGVWPGKATVNGEETLVTKEWLALVPTNAVYRIALPNGGGVETVNAKGFQVAIRDKATLDWKFMDGGNITIADLRSIFPGLPEDIVLPAKGAK